MVFLAVTAEEKGLLGSEYYAANPLYPLAKTVGVINMDALRPARPGAQLHHLRQRQARPARRARSPPPSAGTSPTRPDPKPEAGHFFRSDHFPFAKRGVPAISFGSGNDLVDGGVAAGEAMEKAYIADRYHQPADEWQADWSFTGMARDLQLLYTVGEDLANSTRWPNWAQDSEFRAARDASAAARK